MLASRPRAVRLGRQVPWSDRHLRRLIAAIGTRHARHHAEASQTN
jgi:hypothetical protein